MFFGSLVTLTKVTLICLNIWVIAVVLTVSLGNWRVFSEHNGVPVSYDNSHLIVRREIMEDGGPNMVFSKDNKDSKDKADIPIKSVQAMEPQAPAQIKQAPAPPSLANNVQSWCHKHHPNHFKADQVPSSKLVNIFVDEKHKLLFCGVPGAGYNDWRKILLVTTGIVNTTKANRIDGADVFAKYSKSVKRLSDFKETERAKMLNDFYKVMFVRDPLERLVSAYKGKLVPSWSKYFHKSFGSKIIKKYRKGAKAEDVKNGNNVKFEEFARYIIDTEHEGVASLNEHWQQYYKICHPCIVTYDFVGTFENAESDTDTVLGKIGAKKLVVPPFITETKHLFDKELENTYKTMSSKDLNNLFKIYSPDYTLFGYQCPNFLHKLMEKNTEFHDY